MRISRVAVALLVAAASVGVMAEKVLERVFGNRRAAIVALLAVLAACGATETTERKEISLDLEVLAGFVGRYELEPNFILAITLEDGRLHAQGTDQTRALRIRSQS